MIKRAKISLDGLSCLDTTEYIKMAKKIKEEHENPSSELDYTLKYAFNVKPESIKNLFRNLKYYQGVRMI